MYKVVLRSKLLASTNAPGAALRGKAGGTFGNNRRSNGSGSNRSSSKATTSTDDNGPAVGLAQFEL